MVITNMALHFWSLLRNKLERVKYENLRLHVKGWSRGDHFKIFHTEHAL